MSKFLLSEAELIPLFSKGLAKLPTGIHVPTAALLTRPAPLTIVNVWRLTSSTKLIFGGPMAGLFQSQKALYRLAGRRLRYEVYFAIGLIWMAALLYGAIVNLALQQPVGSGVKTLLVLTALLYGGQLAAFRPWIALACTVVGGIAGLLAYLVNAFTGFYADEIFIGTTVGAARYMFRAHQWTIELAIRASVSNEQHLVAQA